MSEHSAIRRTHSDQSGQARVERVEEFRRRLTSIERKFGPGNFPDLNALDTRTLSEEELFDALLEVRALDAFQ